MAIHNYSESEKLAKDNESFFIHAYKQYFSTTFLSCKYHRNKKEQFAGQDLTIFLKDGRQIKIDEKCRSKYYPDFLLEYEDGRKNASGWMDKDLDIDFIAYGIVPIQKVYLIPWSELKRIWTKYKDNWINKYFNTSAHNDGYTTKSVAVPIAMLLDLIPNIVEITITTQEDYPILEIVEYFKWLNKNNLSIDEKSELKWLPHPTRPGQWIVALPVVKK